MVGAFSGMDLLDVPRRMEVEVRLIDPTYSLADAASTTGTLPAGAASPQAEWPWKADWLSDESNVRDVS